MRPIRRCTPFLLAFALAACAPSPPVTPAPAVGLPGTYAVRLALEDLPDRAPDFLPGEWRVTFRADGTHVVYHDGRPVVRGRHEVRGDRLIYGYQAGPYACVRGGTHAWRIERAQLIFTAVEDGCSGRVVTMTARAWSPLR